MPYNCVAKSLAFSIKKLSAAGLYSAVLYVNKNPTTLLANILDGSVTFRVISNSTLNLTAMDLISIKVTLPSGALPDGVTCSLVIEK